MGIETIGKQIATLRKERGIKQEELAKHVGVGTHSAHIILSLLFALNKLTPF